MVDGFLGRWSQRKQAARTGRPVEEADAAPALTPQPPLPDVRAPTAPATPVANRSAAGPDRDAPNPEAPPPPPPSMQDVAALHAGSDFKPFVARAVAPEVRNAAMKKLFADPHFNVMDGLDTYIDDYSLPDPLPAAMLRQMASAKFMNLFDEEAPADGVAIATSGADPGGVDAAGADQGDAPMPNPNLAQSDPSAGDSQPPEKPEPEATDIRT